jgi:hypothetical protein
MHSSARQLVFHGAVVLLTGLICGAPYGRAIRHGSPASVATAWRLAHSSLPMGAALMFGAGAVLTDLPVDDGLRWTVAVALIISSYAFCVSLPLAATVGHRGLAPGGPLSARLVFTGNTIGALGSLVGATALVLAGWMSL